MDPKWARLAPLLFMLLVALMMAFGLFNPRSLREDNRMVGLTVAPFALPSLDGEQFTPNLWRGKVVMLNVFAPWCVPCISENPELVRLAKAGVVIYGIAWKDKPENVKAYLQVRGNPYQAVGLDAEGQMTIPLGLTGVPQTYIIDKTGRIAYQYNMPITDYVANNTLLPLMKRLENGDAH